MDKANSYIVAPLLIILAALQQFGKVMSPTGCKIILWVVSLSRTFQDQLEEENGHPEQQRQLPAVMIGRGKWDIINSLQHFLK